MAEPQTPDICIIGGGASGLAAARRARAFGAEVTLVEAGTLGGAALRGATIPARALAAAGRRAHYLRTAGPFGIANAEPRISARGVFDYVHEVIDGFTPAASVEQARAAGITLLEGRAKFLDRRTIEVGVRRIRARRFVIATGSLLPVPEIPGLANVPYFTTASIFDNTRKLTHLVVIGGTSAGIEMAQAFRRLGSTVTLLAAGPILPGYDPELAAVMLRQLAAEGVSLRADAQVLEIRQRSLGIGVLIRDAAGEATLDASHILIAGERVPNISELELERADVQRRDDDPRQLSLRADGRTSNPRIYAVGDAAHGGASAVPPEYEADIVVRSALFRQSRRNAEGIVPRVAFTDPEIAEVGVSEAAARNGNTRNFRVIRLSLAENDRAIIERQSYGLAKIVVGHDDRLIGAGVVGTGAAEMISLFGFAIANGMGLKHFRNFAAPYPTLTEIARHLADDDAMPPSGPLSWLLAAGRMLP